MVDRATGRFISVFYVWAQSTSRGILRLAEMKAVSLGGDGNKYERRNV
jgi:hypothetical protein